MIRAITVGNGTWAAAAALAFVARPELAPRLGAAERLALAAELAATPAAMTLAMVLSCLRLFDTASAEDPLANAESPEWKINQRVLSNTIEQAIIFVPALAALAVLDAQHDARRSRVARDDVRSSSLVVASEGARVVATNQLRVSCASALD